MSFDYTFKMPRNNEVSIGVKQKLIKDTAKGKKYQIWKGTVNLILQQKEKFMTINSTECNIQKRCRVIVN